MREKIEKKYIIWFDILGFKNLAIEISDKSNVHVSKIREDMINTINKKIQIMEEKNYITGKNYGERDDWIIILDSIDLVYQVITNLLDHNTGYKFCEVLPLEIGVSIGLYDNNFFIDKKNLITDNSTINFLKSDIVNKYKKWYKQINNEPIKSTFIVFTRDLFNELNSLDKQKCSIIELDNSPFYKINLKYALERGDIFNFLELINKSKNSPYRYIDTGFVSPNEYDEILQTIEKHNIVFLVGDPEIGKTFTSVRILWEYYSKGYDPSWIFGSEFIERKNIRQSMSQFDIQDNQVIYLEDPFGKIYFEDREELRREIGNFIQKIKNTNPKVIITSRSIIFEEFERKKISETELHPLKINMLLINPSYDKDKMTSILINWSIHYNCKWLNNENTKEIVINKTVNTLKTPLSLRDFTFSSKNLTNIKDIFNEIKNKSTEIKKAFAEEIINMKREEFLFLSLINMLFSLEKNKLVKIYNNLCKKYELNSHTYSFEYLEEKFKYRINKTIALYEFTHPSYEEGLVRSWGSNELNAFFRDILNELFLLNDPLLKALCGFALTKNLSELSFESEAKKVILSVLNDKKPDVRNGVAQAASQYFKMLPLDFGNELIEKMLQDRNRHIRATAIDIITANTEKIPITNSIEIIRTGLTDRAAWVRLSAIRSVMIHIDQLPRDIILSALECCEGIRSYTGWFIKYFGSMICRSLESKYGEIIDSKKF